MWTRNTILFRMISLMLYVPGAYMIAIEGDIRLIGSNESIGRVEFFHDGQWGTVCDDTWGDTDATVVCRQLGYAGGLAHTHAHYGMGEGMIWLNGVECLGSEFTLSSCEAFLATEGDDVMCTHSDDAGITCGNKLPEGTVFLAEGSVPWEGRVEFLHNDRWGTVCDDYWDDDDAAVVCTQLGYAGGVALGGGDYGRGTGDIWLDDMRCNGEEKFLRDCQGNVYGSHDCWHSEDAGVLCRNDDAASGIYEDGDVRLVDGPSDREGRVEIYHEGVWGTVCDDSWDFRESLVVCRQLGYTDGDALSTVYRGQISVIMLDDLQCKGEEEKLADCGSRGWEVSNCGHHEDVGVSCY